MRAGDCLKVLVALSLIAAECDPDPPSQPPELSASVTPRAIEAGLFEPFELTLIHTLNGDPDERLIQVETRLELTGPIEYLSATAVKGTTFFSPSPPSQTDADFDQTMDNAGTTSEIKAVFQCLQGGEAIIAVESETQAQGEVIRGAVAVSCIAGLGWDGPLEQGLVILGEALEDDPNAFCDDVILDVDDGSVLHSNGVLQAVHSPSALFFHSVAHAEIDATQAGAELLGDGGLRGTALDTILDPGNGLGFPDGPALLAAFGTYDPVPLEDPEFTYQLGFVFDADGDPDNNYRASPDFPADFFDDTDRWYVAAYDPATGWELQVTDARDGGFVDVSTSSRARIVFVDHTVALIAPIDEFATADPAYRVTTFRHTGDFGLSGGPWEGDVEPPVAAGLRTFNP